MLRKLAAAEESGANVTEQNLHIVRVAAYICFHYRPQKMNVALIYLTRPEHAPGIIAQVLKYFVYGFKVVMKTHK